jgi:two-component system KDP operon response regulator KdpE
MARLESGIAGGAVNLRRDWQSVEEVVGSAIRAARTSLGDAVVQTALDADLPLVEFDAVLIERVLVNLLENATKYGAPPIVVGARAEPGTLVLTVRDHGPGPARRAAGPRTEAVRQVHARRGRIGHAGRGLGLAICKAVVSAHGGEITAAATRATAVQNSPSPCHAASRPNRPKPNSEAMPSPTAIVIEDEPQIRRFVRGALEAEGWLVHEAGTLRDGLAAAGTRQPDLLVLDLGLPDGDGVSLIRDVRGWSAVPIIVLSARTDEADKIAALDAGADDYLTKPFGTGELLARVRANLRRPRAAGGGNDEPPEAAFRFGEIELDRAARIVRRAGAEVHLTPTEYRLLSVLVANAGRVLTQRQLLREVWGPSHTDQSHYLRIYMGHLRQKLEADPAQPRHLLTETAVGYRLVV